MADVRTENMVLRKALSTSKGGERHLGVTENRTNGPTSLAQVRYVESSMTTVDHSQEITGSRQETHNRQKSAVGKLKD